MPAEKKKVSIIDVAKQAGVSTATVSRVINGLGGYSKATEEKVRKTIEECHFTPNVNAIGLRTNKSHSIGVIIPKITNEFFAKIVHELDIYLVDHGYSLFICDSNEDHALEDMHVKNLIDKNVDGIIYISGKNNVVRFETGIPFVYIDRAPEDADVLVLSDNVNGGYIAAKELLDKGCKRILFIRDLRAQSTYRYRKEGFLKGLQERGIAFDEEMELSCFPEFGSMQETLEKVIKSNGLFFDGIFATTDMMAVACLSLLNERGIQVPEQVKIVGFDNISITQFTNPPITTVSQDTRQMALTAGKTILRMINKQEIKNKRKVIPVKLEVRKTT